MEASTTERPARYASGFSSTDANRHGPTVAKGEGWDELYASQAKGLDVLPTADEAVEWANALVAKIDAAK